MVSLLINNISDSNNFSFFMKTIESLVSWISIFWYRYVTITLNNVINQSVKRLKKVLW